MIIKLKKQNKDCAYAQNSVKCFAYTENLRNFLSLKILRNMEEKF